jgi:hypothetical protein
MLYLWTDWMARIVAVGMLCLFCFLWGPPPRSGNQSHCQTHAHDKLSSSRLDHSYHLHLIDTVSLKPLYVKILITEFIRSLKCFLHFNVIHIPEYCHLKNGKNCFHLMKKKS